MKNYENNKNNIGSLNWKINEGNFSNKKEDNFLNWEDDAHRRAAAGRDGWDEDWFPHETL